MSYTSTIIIPCYNEFARLPADACIDHLKLYPQHACCFVDDGSTDNTASLIKSITDNCSNAYCLKLTSNKGKADAVREGMGYALKNIPATFYGYMDADLATPLSFISIMEQTLLDNPHKDMVFGSRQLAEGNAVERKAFRHAAGRGVSRLINWALHKNYSDTQCGAKLFSANAASFVFEEPFTTTWIFDVEIIKRLQLNKNFGAESILEIPVNQWKDVGNSKVSAFYFFKMIREILKVKGMR